MTLNSRLLPRTKCSKEFLRIRILISLIVKLILKGIFREQGVDEEIEPISNTETMISIFIVRHPFVQSFHCEQHLAWTKTMKLVIERQLCDVNYVYFHLTCWIPALVMFRNFERISGIVEERHNITNVHYTAVETSEYKSSR